MILKNFQKFYVDKLLDRFNELVELKSQKKLTFKSPTGSGKTIMMAEFINQLSKKKSKSNNLCFVWTAPRKLHQQSKAKLAKYLGNASQVDLSYFNDLKEKKINRNEILFLNWESINKKNKNTIILENENEFYLNKIIENTLEDGLDIILIIDESHFNAPSTISKSLISDIKAKVIIEVSATPTLSTDETVSVPMEKVQNEALIKNSVVINEKFKNILNNNTLKSNSSESADEFILSQAIKKRNQLATIYKKNRSKVNPLLLIQIPDKIKSDEQDYFRNNIEKFLDKKFGINIKNRKLAVYLSEDKENLDFISENDNKCEVLIFKQAIALGWDCPRAQILVLFRHWKSLTFSIQTVGRIMRMPEADKFSRYYNHNQLNDAYVYTNSNSINIADEISKNYFSVFTSSRQKLYKKLKLKSYDIVRQREKDRLDSSFENVFQQVCKKHKLKNKIQIKNQRITGELITDYKSTNIDNLKEANSETVNINLDNLKDVQRIFDKFIIDNLHPFYPQERSVNRLKICLYNFFKNNLSLDYKYDFHEISRIMLSKKNRNEFEKIIEITKNIYSKNIENKKRQVFTNNEWEVPEEINYTANSTRLDTQKSIMKPFYIEKQWKTEMSFIKFLEKQNKVKWWFKNGDQGRTFFAIPYKTDNDIATFYIDFIINLKDKILLCDTKSGKFIEDSGKKLSGLKIYISKESKTTRKIKGGIVSNTDNKNFKGIWKIETKNKMLNESKIKDWENLSEYL